MKAAVLREVNRPLEIEDVQVADPGPREVLLRTGATGVCHSDLHFVEGLYATPMPVVLGHEAAGTIEAVGELVDYVKPGDRVICCLSVFCGHCERCTEGRTVLCSRAGLTRGPGEPPRLSAGSEEVTQFANLGSFAEQMLVHENSVVKIDRDIPFEQMALIGCGATTGLGAAMNTAAVRPGSTVAVIGCGGVGLNAVQGAVLAGALRVIAIDAVETKLTLAPRVRRHRRDRRLQRQRGRSGARPDLGRSRLLFRGHWQERDGRAVVRHAAGRGHRHHHRHDPPRDQDRARRPVVPAGSGVFRAAAWAPTTSAPTCPATSTSTCRAA